MKVYRIVKHTHTSLDGAGAAIFPGRWNELHVPCIYTSDSIALAQLEIMANAEDWRIYNRIRHKILEIEIKDAEIINIDNKKLPATWDQPDVHYKSQEFGSKYLRDTKVVAFSVPSVVQRLERNIIINPSSTKFNETVKVIRQVEFFLDKRFLK
jgi:RES domain-containing protein